jgi:hypothetical protein
MSKLRNLSRTRWRGIEGGKVMSHKTALKVYAALTLIVGSWVPAMAGTDGKVLPGAACVATYAH